MMTREREREERNYTSRDRSVDMLPGTIGTLTSVELLRSRGEEPTHHNQRPIHTQTQHVNPSNPSATTTRARTIGVGTGAEKPIAT